MKLKKLLLVALPYLVIYCFVFSSCSSAEENKESDPRVTTLKFEPYNDSTTLKKAKILNWHTETDKWSGKRNRRYVETHLSGGIFNPSPILTITYDLDNYESTIELGGFNMEYIGENITFESYDLNGNLFSRKIYMFDRISNHKIRLKKRDLKDTAERDFFEKHFIETKCLGDSCVWALDTLYQFTKIIIPTGEFNYKKNILEKKSEMQIGWINFNMELYKQQLISFHSLNPFNLKLY